MADWARLLSGCRGSLDRGFESRPPRHIEDAFREGRVFRVDRGPLAKHTRIQTVTIFGGVPASTQIRALRHDPEIVVGQRVEVLTRQGPVPGLVGKKAIHLMEKEDRDRPSRIKDLWIDIGARDGADARERVRVGDAAVLDVGVVELPNGRIASRSIDNRVGAFIILEALRRLAAERPSVSVIAVATAQEEIGAAGGGARTGAFGLDPRVAVVVDVTHATDHPGAEKKGQGDHRLGGGPVLSRGSAVNPVLFERMAHVADAENIPFSIEASPSRTSTDADNIYTARMGIATALVSVPNRYMHTPNEMVELDDLDRAAELIAATVRTLTAADDFVPV